MPKTAALRRQASTSGPCAIRAPARDAGKWFGKPAERETGGFRNHAETERVSTPAVAGTAAEGQGCGGLPPRGVRIVRRAPGMSRSLFNPFNALMDATVVR